MPMDVDFMLDDLLETLRPKGRPKSVKDGPAVNRLRTFPEAAQALDTMLAANATGKHPCTSEANSRPR